MKPDPKLLRMRNWPWALIPLRHLPKLRYFGIVSLRQCSSYASVRVERFLHLLHFYKLLYNERTVSSLLRNIYTRWYRQLRPRLQAVCGGMLMSATAFSFVDGGISDDEMFKAIDLLDSPESDKSHLTEESEQSLTVRGQDQNTTAIRRTTKQNDSTSGWEPLITKDHFRLHRRPLRGYPYLYEYRCSGSYDDITPTAFFIAQMDLEYRKQWDRLVVSLDVVDVEKQTGSEVVHWVTHFPYPMYPREYVYVRRACVDQRQGTFIITSKSVEHPTCPREQSKMVRVDAYYSCMVIKAHGNVDENGFDYVLTYFDDPKAPFPQVAYNWMVNTGVMGFLDKVHTAAKGLIWKRSMSTEQQQATGAGASGGGSIANWQRLMRERYNYSF